MLKHVPRWVPGMEWKRKGLEYRAVQEATRTLAFKESLKCLVSEWVGTLSLTVAEDAMFPGGGNDSTLVRAGGDGGLR